MKVATEPFTAAAARAADVVRDGKTGAVLLRAAKSTLMVAGSSLDITLTSTMPCDGDLDISIDAAELARIASSLPGADVTITEESGWAHIRSGKARYKAPCTRGRDYASIPRCDVAWSPIDPAALSSALDRGSYAAAVGDHGILCGILLDASGGTVLVASIHGSAHRLAMCNASAPGEVRAVVPPRFVKVAISMLDASDSADLHLGDHRAFLRCSDTVLHAAWLNGEWPSRTMVSGAVGLPRPVTATVVRKDFAAALKRVSQIVNGELGVVFDLSQGEVKMTAADGNGREICDEVAAEVSGELKIKIAPKYLLDALARVESETAIIRAGTSTDPILITDGVYSALVMPQRL